MTIKQHLWQTFLTRAYPKWLLGIFAIWFAVWAVNPAHPKDFFMEHLVTVAALVLLWWSYNRFRLSNLSSTMLFVYFCFHSVGAHYTYAGVPYEEWARGIGSLFGREDFTIRSLFGFTERNHYDRLMHFLGGLMLAYPVRELFVRIVGVRGFWGYYLPLDVMMSFSMLYELLEWAVAVLIGGQVGQDYLGAQGDMWDAQKDMALATLGGFTTVTVTALVNWYFGIDFDSEPQGSAPLGEVRLDEMMKQKSAAKAVEPR